MTQIADKLRDAIDALSALQPEFLAEVKRLRIEDPDSPRLRSMTCVAVAYKEALDASVIHMATDWPDSKILN